MREVDIAAARAALVLNRFNPIDEPAQALINRFCTDEAKAGPLLNSQTFELHNHKRYLIENPKTEVNSWVRCRTAIITQSGAPAIALEQDINTTEEQGPVQFSPDSVSDFMRHALTESDTILKIYFPEGS